MEEQKSISKSVVATISALAAVATVVGGSLAWFNVQHQSNQPPTKTNNPIAVNPVNPSPNSSPLPIQPLPSNPSVGTSPVTPSSPLPQVNQGATNPPQIAQNNERKVKIWRLDDDGKKTFLVPQEREAPKPTSQDPSVLTTRSLTNLLASAGKPDGKLTSTIPVGTKLLGVEVKGDGIHINLSKEFTQGFGATSMIGRLGQVVYTATESNPDAPVWISVEGKPLEVLGDVGVEIRQPITRQLYNRDFPINPTNSETNKN
jgi:spore germination protein GerM